MIGPAGLQGRIGVVSFEAEGAHSHDICHLLGARGICLRGGHHCAQPLMDRFGVVATARASLAPTTMPPTSTRCWRASTRRSPSCDERPAVSPGDPRAGEAGAAGEPAGGAAGERDVDNPLCGDRVTLDLNLADGRVREVGHKVRGCLLCQAAAAAIGERAPGEIGGAARVAQDLGDAIARAPDTAGRRWPSSRRSRPCMRTRAGTNACCCRSRRWRRRWNWPKRSSAGARERRPPRADHVPTRRKPVRCRTDANQRQLRHAAAGWLPIT